MPFYSILQLASQTKHHSELKPNKSSDALQQVASSLRVLPFSITVGYILPTVLMCTDCYHPQTHQGLVAIWQAFPLRLWRSRSLFVSYDMIQGHTHPKSEDQPRKIALKETWTVLQRIYLFGIYLASFTHIATLALAVATKFFPSLFMQTTLTAFAPSLS